MSLLRLPLEIRNEIFSYVLTSPTGLIVLLGQGGRGPNRFLIGTSDAPKSYISLAFLRTCKQIYNETKDLKPLWMNNALSISHSLDSVHVCKIPKAVTSRVENVHFEFTFTPTEAELSRQEEIFRHLRTWDNLKSITLFVRSEYEDMDSLWGYSFFNVRFNNPSYFKNLEILNTAVGKKGYNYHLKRELHISMGKRKFGEGGHPLICFNAEDGSPNQLLEDWANVFGGRLLLDGTVCYDNGALVQPAFVVDPDENDVEMENTTEANYVLRIDANICKLAVLFTEAKGEVVWKCAGKAAERIYDTYSNELLDYICHDWGLTSSWSIEQRMEMVEQRTREFRQRSKN